MTNAHQCLKMPHAGEHHSDAVAVGGLDHFIVAKMMP
jgi:hypothetical protein